MSAYAKLQVLPLELELLTLFEKPDWYSCRALGFADFRFKYNLSEASIYQLAYRLRQQGYLEKKVSKRPLKARELGLQITTTHYRLTDLGIKARDQLKFTGDLFNL